MKPEAAFLIALARGEVQRAVDFFRESRDGDLIAPLATLHQIDALCSWMWRRHTTGATGLHSSVLPEFVTRPLRHAYLHHLLRNEALARDVTDLQESLAARGVEGLCLKGPYLAFRSYPDPGTRPISDIDLCVREEQYDGALAALEDRGYVPCASPPRRAEEALQRAHYGGQLRFVARGRRPVELHFRMVNAGPPSPDERWVWETRRDLVVGSCSLSIPGPEAMLLHLLLHANQHGFALLRLLHDIRWMIDCEGAAIDWDFLSSRIRQLRFRAGAYHALLLARDLAGAEVPEKPLKEWQPSLPRRKLFSMLWRLPAARRLEAPRRRMETESPLLFLLEMGSVSEKSRYVAGLIREAGGLARFLARLGHVSSMGAKKKERAR